MTRLARFPCAGPWNQASFPAVQSKRPTSMGFLLRSHTRYDAALCPCQRRNGGIDHVFASRCMPALRTRSSQRTDILCILILSFIVRVDSRSKYSCCSAILPAKPRLPKKITMYSSNNPFLVPRHTQVEPIAPQPLPQYQRPLDQLAHCPQSHERSRTMTPA